LKKIAVLIGGGVAPGMNAAVRAVAQAAFSRSWEVVGVENAYDGLLEGRLQPIDRSHLGGLMHRGGTVLGTGRSKEVREPEGQGRAVRRLEEEGVEGLVIIGGGGSLASAKAMGEAGVKVVGVPATIDNDVPGTELAIGTDTAIDTAVKAIDRIRGTAISHNRAHIVKVMGSDSGYLALMSAIAGGAEIVLVPEFTTRPEEILRFLKKVYEQGKSHFIVVAAEGGRAFGGGIAGVHQRGRRNLRGRPDGGGAHPIGWGPDSGRPHTGCPARGRGGGGLGRRRPRDDGRGQGRRGETRPACDSGWQGAPARPGALRTGPATRRDAGVDACRAG
jgi:6-phosphofructokinase